MYTAGGRRSALSSAAPGAPGRLAGRPVVEPLDTGPGARLDDGLHVGEAGLVVRVGQHLRLQVEPQPVDAAAIQVTAETHRQTAVVTGARPRLQQRPVIVLAVALRRLASDVEPDAAVEALAHGRGNGVADADEPRRRAQLDRRAGNVGAGSAGVGRHVKGQPAAVRLRPVDDVGADVLGPARRVRRLARLIALEAFAEDG